MRDKLGLPRSLENGMRSRQECGGGWEGGSNHEGLPGGGDP